MRRAYRYVFWCACGTLPAVLHGQGRATVDSLMGPGVSLALAQTRATRISNVRYDLSLEVSERDTASGRVTVEFQVERPTDVVIDFRGPALTRSRANGRVSKAIAWNGAHIRVPSAFVKVGVNRLDFEFKTMVAAAGASIIRVRDPSDGAVYLYTLLVPSDANQLFPCFDQPDLKARVNLTLTTPLGWRAVANGRQLRADSTSRGSLHVFQESEPISTYLIAFAAGPWVARTSAASQKPITLYVRKSRATELDADSVIAANDRAASWLEQYFARPFPFQKLDVVLAPAFPFGGMEHPGAIFYSEERFVFRERPTRSQSLGRIATIYHEVAHQWFGDLVTMKWFDDLWLKEGFATYMAAKMQAALDPSSEAWKTFYLRNKPPAYAVDVTEGTTPVWQRLGNLDQAKSNYGPIVYNKTPSVLKQLNYVVEEAAFRDGLRAFLRRHEYANATWRDLLDAVGTASKRNLRPWGDAYMLRPGVPVIEQRVESKDGRVTRLTLVQHPARPMSGPEPWPVKLEVVAGSDGAVLAHLPVRLTADSTAVPMPDSVSANFVFANGGDEAYALVLMDSGTVSVVERTISGVQDGLLRAQLWGALWDLVRDARLSPDRFVRLALRELPRERDDQIVAVILSRLTRATTAYLTGSALESLAPEVELAMWRGVADSSRSYDIRKAELDAFVRVAATPSAVARLEGILDSTMIAGAPLRSPTRWAIVTRLMALQTAGAERRLNEEVRRDSTAEGARRAFVAAAARPDPETKATLFRRYFADSTLNEDWVTASLEAFNDLRAQGLSRRYLRAALDSLPWIQRNRRIFFLGSWISAFLDGQSDEEALRIVRTYLEDQGIPADLRAKVLQSEDELERTVRIRRGTGGARVSDEASTTGAPRS